MFRQMLWQSSALMPIAIGASLVIVAIVWWIYRRPLRFMRGRSRWMMPILRGVALVVLAISMLRPVIVRPRTAAERGAVVLLIDRSPSMGIVDRGRSASQLVALADGLQMLPAGIRSEHSVRLDDLPDAIASLVNDLFLARGQLDYARVSGSGEDRAEQELTQLATRVESLSARLVDYPSAQRVAQKLAAQAGDMTLPADQWVRQITQLGDQLTDAITQAQTASGNSLYRQNDSVRDACDELTQLSRLKIIERALLGPKPGVLERLQSQTSLFGFTFAQDVAPVALQDASGSVRFSPLEVQGERTDLTGALRSVRERMQGVPLQAIVLISDGRQIGGDGQLSQLLTTSSAPIFTVNASGPVRKDMALLRLQRPGRPFVGQAGAIRAELAGIGCRGESVNVILRAAGKEQTQMATVGDRDNASVDFPIRFDQPGEQSYVVTIAPQPGEATQQNNRAEIRITVQADKVKVLALTGWPGWEFQQMQSALSASPFIEYRAAILTNESPSPALTPDELMQQDVLLLSEVRASQLNADQWAAVERLVSDRGGSVILVPGDPRTLIELARQPDAGKLIPFGDAEDAAWRVWPGDEPYFQLSIAPGAENSDALRLADDSTQNVDRWNALQGIYRFLPVSDLRSQVRSLLIERDSELPVLTEERIGNGRAFFFGVRETWRWHDRNGMKDRNGSNDADRFWLQLVRYASRQRATSPRETEVMESQFAELANVSGDEARLQRIAEGTGGEMLKIEDIADLPDTIRRASERQTGLVEYPLWSSGYLFAFVVACFCVEWAMRKQAGLA